MSVDLNPIICKAEFLLLEQSVLAGSGPEFCIVHRFRVAGTSCRAGEEVFAVFLEYRGQHTLVTLPLAPRLVFDYLGHHRHFGQSASQIAAGMRASTFYRNHARNSGELSCRKISRSAIKEYVLRIRRALEAAFQQASVPLDPAKVLVSEPTEGNEVLYRLHAKIQYQHWDELSGRR